MACGSVGRQVLSFSFVGLSAFAELSDQDGVLRVLEEFAAMKLAHQGLVDFTAGEVKASQIAIVRNPRP